MFDHLPCTSPCPPTPPTTLTTHPCDGSVPSYDTNAPTAVVFFFLHPLHLDGVAVAHFFHVVRMRRTTSPLPHAPTPIHPSTHPPPNSSVFAWQPVPPPLSCPHPCFVPFLNTIAHFFYFLFSFLFVLFSQNKTLN